jgi:hypothetical protein
VLCLKKPTATIMSCPELEDDLRLIASELATERQWLAVCRQQESEAHREAKVAQRQIKALLLQADRIERALEECRARGWRGR